MIRVAFAGLILSIAVVGSALTDSRHGHAAAGIVVDAPWSRATPGRSPNGAAYMTLRNQGSVADRLISAATPAAARATLHTHLIENGVMKMRPLAAIEVAPGSPTVLAPGGLHIMLHGLKRPLRAGERFPLSLAFEHAGTITVQVMVQKIGARVPMSDHGAKTDHGKGS